MLLSATVAVLSTDGAQDSGADYTSASIRSKGSATINVNSDPSSASVGSSVHFSGVLIGKNRVGTSPIGGATVRLSVILPGGTTVYPAQGSRIVTRSDGTFSADYIVQSVGTHSFVASYAGSRSYSGTTITIQFEGRSVAPPVEPPVPPAPAPTVLSLTGVGSLEIGSLEGINGTLKTAAGVAIIGAPVIIQITDPDGGKIGPSTLTTNVNGGFSYSLTPTKAGSYAASVNYSGNASYSASTGTMSFVANAPPAPPTASQSVIILSGASTAFTGSTVSIAGTLKTTTGTAIPNAAVTVQITNPDGSKTSTSSTTNANGGFSYSLSPAAVGTYTVSANFAGNTNYMGSASTMSIAASAPMPPPTATYDYMVSSSVVKNSAGTTVYTGSDLAAALKWATSQAGKTTYVPAGTYTISGLDAQCITPFANGVTLYGDGPSATVFNFMWTGGVSSHVWDHTFTFGFKAVNVNDVVLRDFGVTGDGGIRFYTTSGTTTNNVVEDVRVFDTGNEQLSAFGVMVSPGCVADGYRFTRCVAFNVGGDGFDLWGTVDDLANAGYCQNILYEDCIAQYCGYTFREWDWCVGFDFGERCHVQNIVVNRCEASYNWESGFHFEERLATHGGCVLTDCVANFNGQKYTDPRGPMLGYGFLQQPSITLVRPTGVGNARGLLGGYAGMGYSFAYPDNGVKYYTYTLNSNVVKDSAGTIVYTGTDMTDALKWAVGHTNAIVYVPEKVGYAAYALTGTIPIATGVTLYGAIPYYGSPRVCTNFAFSGTTGTEGFLISNAGNTHLFNFGVIGGHILYSATGGTTMVGNEAKGIVVSQTPSSHASAFGTYCDGTSTIDGLELGDVVVIDSRTDGFGFKGAGGSATLKNLQMTLCQAKNSGVATPRNDLSVGYRFGAGVKMMIATVYECDADSSWCSGFYFSAGTTMSSVTLTDCSASNNGQKGDTSNGMGYLLNGQSGVLLVNCGGVGNKGSLKG